jgi:simple sugar transport system permease protein
MTAPVYAPREPTEPSPEVRKLESNRWFPYAIALLAVAVMSAARLISDNDDLTSSGTFGVALRTAAPIGMAGLSGLVAERSGTINIGIEGMMVMGTIFAGWWGWEYGPYAAILGGMLGGLIAGLVMSLATTTFGVNHIVAGVAINLIAPGVSRFMASELFSDAQGGSVTSSPGNSGDIGEITVPILSSGVNDDDTGILGSLEDTGWFIIADLAGFFRGMTTEVTIDVLIAAGLFVLIAYVLWHTPFGLRLRSAGERPAAADSLGVNVHLMRYYGMAISGALAGMGGAILVLFANRYQENQVAGRGFLGLATMIFGNWMPAGTAAGAGLFGYAQGITLRTNPGELVRALLLAAAIGLAITAIWMIYQRSLRGGGIIVLISLATFYAYFVTERPNNQLVFVTPYVVTLIAVSVGAQRQRPPAEEGIPWFKGMQ